MMANSFFLLLDVESPVDNVLWKARFAEIYAHEQSEYGADTRSTLQWNDEPV